jgi:membrane associated rhomboid family serine protease
MFPLKDDVPSKSFPFINTALIAVNIAVFFHEIQLDNAHLLEPFMKHFALIPARFLAAPAQQFFTIFSAMFLHGSWGHVLGNMWFLFIFGDNVEDKLGHIRYLIYYLLVGVGAAAAQIYMSPHSHLPMVGASGAIAGVLGGYFILFQGAHILTFFIFIFFIRFIEVPAFFYLIIWFVIQAFSGIGSLTPAVAHGDMGGVAWWAHVGGFASGFILINFFRRNLPRS